VNGFIPKITLIHKLTYEETIVDIVVGFSGGTLDGDFH
jgi:hypothetical protein